MKAKSAVLGMAAAAAFSGATTNVARAAACPVAGTTGAFTKPGFSCTVGDKLFSNFVYTDTGGGVPPGGVTVTPATSAGEIGLKFNAGWAAGAKTAADVTFSFKVATTNGALISDAFLHIDGVVGKVVDVENISSGGKSVAGGTLTVTKASSAATTFLMPPQSAITANDDISIAAGGRVSDVTKEFSQVVPEPATLSLLGVGLGALGLVGIRRRKRH